ncbi:DUF2262 domain-containing protein [Planctomicrobium sp. SH527]|uniref:DUF2262 domain-containing protein n=1 Tax=Planctomicrobium sp. SH527 TaxID=3448123 RepID=UPI003F5C6E10
MRFDELSICKRAETWDDLRFYQNQLQAFSILEVHGRITLDPVFGTLICELIDIVGPVSDAELEDFANQLQNPVTFQDRRLGTFTLDRRIESYEAQINWQKRKVSLTLDAMEPEELADLLAVARRLFDEQAEWTRKTKDYAVLELLEEKAADWQADFGVRLTAQKFKSFMTLNSISIKRDRTFEFWYDDGDLYGGHYITLSGDFEHGLTEARIAG